MSLERHSCYSSSQGDITASSRAIIKIRKLHNHYVPCKYCCGQEGKRAEEEERAWRGVAGQEWSGRDWIELGAGWKEPARCCMSMQSCNMQHFNGLARNALHGARLGPGCPATLVAGSYPPPPLPNDIPASQRDGGTNQPPGPQRDPLLCLF